MLKLRGVTPIPRTLEDGLVLRLEAPTGLTNLGSAVTTPTYSGGMGTVSSDGRLAFSSDGVDDFISIAVGIIPAVFPITVAYWSKSAGEARIAWNRNNVTNRYIWFRSGTVSTTAGRLTSRHAATLHETLATTNTATTNTWVHNCFIVNSATSRRVILNGDYANSVTSTADTGQGTVANEVGGTLINSFQIGASTLGSDGTTYFEQLTDSVRLYSRVLSEAEIQFLASARGVESPPKKPTIRNRQLSDSALTVNHDYITVQTAGGTTNLTAVQDANFNVYTGATYHREGRIEIEGGLSCNCKIINLDPSVGSIAEDGIITRVSSGIMRVHVESFGLRIGAEFDMRDKADEGGDQPRVYVSTVAGSLAAHCQAQIDSRINNTMTMATNGLVYTTQDHATPSYVRNPNLWCADVDLTAVSPWNSNAANRKAGLLVTQRHVLNAAHYQYGIGTIVRFIGNDGTVYDRTVTGRKTHPAYVPYYPDLTLYTLDSDLPAAITPCKVMPTDYGDYLVHNYHNRPPGVGFDQEEKALIIDFVNNGSFMTPVDVDRLLFHENKVGGDSGNPAGLIVNGEFVAITVWTFGGAGSGTPIANFHADLNGMIVSADAQAGVSTGYTVTPADFTGFTNFG